MCIHKDVAAAIVSIVMVVGSCAHAFAETFIDIYGGVAGTSSRDVTVSVFNFPSPDITATKSITFDDSVSVGVRAGGWSASLPWLGGGVDLSYFRADGDNMKIAVIPLSTLVMFRYPLFRSSDYSSGRLQPYAAIGPGFFFYHASADFRPRVPKEVNENGYSVGIDVRAGLTLLLTRRVGVFGEYRYTYFTIDENFLDRFGVGIETNHLLCGLSFRF